MHIGQEFEFSKAVVMGATLVCNAKLLQNSVRRGFRFMVVHLEVNDDAGQRVMEGRSTITVPA